jgi:hypothetical protein
MTKNLKGVRLEPFKTWVYQRPRKRGRERFCTLRISMPGELHEAIERAAKQASLSVDQFIKTAMAEHATRLNVKLPGGLMGQGRGVV